MITNASLPAAKLCYGLDGRNHSVPSAPPPPAWHDWAQRQARTLASVSAYPLSIQEVGTRAQFVASCCIWCCWLPYAGAAKLAKPLAELPLASV